MNTSQKTKYGGIPMSGIPALLAFVSCMGLIRPDSASASQPDSHVKLEISQSSVWENETGTTITLKATTAKPVDKDTIIPLKFTGTGPGTPSKEVLYSNIHHPTGEFIQLKDGFEYGDQVNFSYTLDAQTITDFEFETFSQNLGYDTVGVLRFYNADSKTTLDVGALRLQTVEFPIGNGYQTHSISGFVLELNGMETLIWSLTVKDIPHGGSVGLTLSDPPTVGSNLIDYFESPTPGDPSQFVLKKFQTSESINFTSIFEGDAIPVVPPVYTTSGPGIAMVTKDYTLSDVAITIPAGHNTGTITITIIDDYVVERIEKMIAAIDFTDPITDGICNFVAHEDDPTEVMLTICDDDAIVVDVVDAYTSEDGGKASLKVTLGQKPLAPVSVGISSSDLTEGQVSQGVVFFSVDGWNVPQVITVTGLDDLFDDGDVAYEVLFSNVYSQDSLFNNAKEPSVWLTNKDNDEDASGIIVIYPSSYDESQNGPLYVSEDGTSQKIGFRLASKPVAPVSVGVSSSDLTEGNISDSVIFLTPETWNVTQYITVTGLDDTTADGPVPFQVLLSDSFSIDPNYNGVTPENSAVEFINLDNESSFAVDPAHAHPADTNNDGYITHEENQAYYLANYSDPAKILTIYSGNIIVGSGGNYYVDNSLPEPDKWVPGFSSPVHTGLTGGRSVVSRSLLSFSQQITDPSQQSIHINYVDKDGTHGILRAADGVYVLLGSTDLTSWTPIRNVSVANGLGTFFDGQTDTASNRFYTAVVVSSGATENIHHPEVTTTSGGISDTSNQAAE